MAGSRGDDHIATDSGQSASNYDQPTARLARERGKCPLDFIRLAHVHRPQVDPQRRRDGLQAAN